MSSNFDPKINKNPKLIDSNILSKNGNALVQSPKENNTGILGLIKKAIHWIFYPNERISRICDVFNVQLRLFEANQTNQEEATANLYANCKYFNERVIKKHNDSWISFFLFWNRVPFIDEKRLENLKIVLENKLCMSLENCKNEQSLTDLTVKATRFDCHSQLLRQTEALEMFPKLAKMRTELKEQQEQLKQSLSTFFNQTADRISKSTQLQEDDLTFLLQAEHLNVDLSGIDSHSRIKTLVDEKKQVQNKRDALYKNLSENIPIPSKEQIVTALMGSKYISTQSKNELRESLANYDWESKVSVLMEKVANAQNATEVAALKDEVTRLEQTKPARADLSRISLAKRKIDLLERLERARQSTQAHVPGTPISADMQAQHQALGAEVTKLAMSANPHVANIQRQANAIFADAQKHAEECAWWKDRWNRLQKNNTDTVSKHLDRLASGAIRLQEDNTEPYERVLNSLPEGQAKTDLRASKQAYDTHFQAMQQIVAHAKEIRAFCNTVNQESHPITSKDFAQLEAFATKYPQPEIKTLIDEYKKELMKKVDALVDGLADTKKALNKAVPESMAPVLIAIANVLQNDSSVLDLLDDAKQKETAKKHVEQLLAVHQYYNVFQTNFDRYSELTAKPEAATIAMNMTGWPLPTLFQHLDDNSSLLAQFYPQRWSYHLNGVSNAIQQTTGSDLDAITSALQAIIKEIDDTKATVRATNFYKIETQCKKQLALLRTMQKTHAEWIELSKMFSSSQAVVERRQIVFDSLKDLGLNDNPLVKSVTSLASDVITKFTGYEAKIAYYKAFFERTTKLLETQAQDSPGRMIETYADRAAFDAFMAELPDCAEKKDLQQKCHDFEQFLLEVKNFKIAMAPIHTLLEKVSAKKYFPTKEDFDAVHSIQDTKNRFSSAYLFHRTRLVALYNQQHRNSLGVLYHYQDPDESLFEKSTDEFLDRNLSDAKKLKQLTTDAGAIASLDKTIVNTEKMKKMKPLYDAFKAEYKAYEAMPKDGSGVAPTVYTPSSALPELVTLLGERHPISKKYLSMIHTTFFSLKLEPELRRLANAIHETNGENLKQLDEQLKKLKAELDQLKANDSEQQAVVAKYKIARVVLDDLLAFQKNWQQKIDLIKRSKSLVDIQENAFEVRQACARSPLKEHPYIKSIDAWIANLLDEYEDINASAVAAYGFKTDTDAQLEDLVKQDGKINDLNRKLDAYEKKYPDHAGISLAKDRLVHLHLIIAGYPDYKLLRDDFITSASAEITALEGAANSFGAVVLQSPLPTMPLLVETLGTEHAVLKPFIESYDRLVAVRNFAKNCSTLQHLIASQAEPGAIAHSIACIDTLVPKVKAHAPQLEVHYQAIATVPRKAVQAQLETHKAHFAILETLRAMNARPEENKRQLSLHFFYKDKDIKSSYQQAQEAASASAEDKEFIELVIKKCFPEIIFRDVVFVEKCSKIWKGDEAPTFDADELMTLDALVKAPGLPLPLKLQFELLQKMQKLQFHPRNICPITMGPLLDPVVTNTVPPRYYDRSALQKWLHSHGTDPFTRSRLSINDVKHKPEIGELVQEWLLCKNLMKRPAGSAQDMLDKLMRHSPENIRKLLSELKGKPFNLEPCTRNCTLIERTINSWAQNGQNQNYWINLLVETNTLLMQVANYTQISEKDYQYESIMPHYVAKLFKMAANLEVLYPKLETKLFYFVPELKNLKDSIQLLHIVLNNEDAFTEANFKQSLELIGKIVMVSSLPTLIQSITDGFNDGSAPSGDDANPPRAFSALMVRVYARNSRHESRTTQSSEDYRRRLLQIQQFQQHTLYVIWKSKLNDIQQLIHQLLLQLQTFRDAYVAQQLAAAQRQQAQLQLQQRPQLLRR